jgi:hypothetical protein
MAVTVTRAKATHSRYTRVLFGGSNLSGDARSLSSIGTSYDRVDATGWTDAGLKEYLMGMGDNMFGPFQAMLNAAVADVGPVRPGVHTALSALGDPLATAVIGMGENPTIGAPAFSTETSQTSYTATAANADVVLVNGDFTTKAGAGTIGGWGQVLAVGTSYSSSQNLGSLDGAAATSNGFIAFLHIEQSVGAMAANEWEVKIQDSANDSTFADIGAFTLDGSAAGAERISATGTVRRYVRAVLTKTDGTDLKAWVNFIRL